MKLPYILAIASAVGLVSCGQKQDNPEAEKPQTVDVASVTLDQAWALLVAGGSLQLSAAVLPEDATDKTVRWSSSQPKVAVVSADGTIAALTEGSSTITAQAGEISASCSLTVAAPAPEDGFSLSPSQISIPAQGGLFQVQVHCTSSYHLNGVPDWIHQEKANGSLHTFSASANAGEKARSAVLVFCDDIGTCLPCLISQAAQ